MRRTHVGWFLSVTGFLACPCHLIITLPLAAALLGGTTLGDWIAGHQGAILVGALIGSATLLLAGKSMLASGSTQPQDTRSIPAPRIVAPHCCAASVDEI